jgi:hypothetical protein
VDVKPEIATYEHVGQLRENIYRYFGVSEDAIQGKLFGDAWEAFYDSAIEPFLIALGLELTYKVYTERQRGFGNEVVFESSRMQYMSMDNKLKLIQLVDRKTMLPNELRAILNLPPVPWGDEPLFWQDPKGEAEGKLQEADNVDRKTMLPNELRAILNLPPVPWGDEPLFWQDPKGEAELKETDKEPEKGEEDASQTE